jgi:hypothetical protein
MRLEAGRSEVRLDTDMDKRSVGDNKLCTDTEQRQLKKPLFKD